MKTTIGILTLITMVACGKGAPTRTGSPDPVITTTSLPILSGAHEYAAPPDEWYSFTELCFASNGDNTSTPPGTCQNWGTSGMKMHMTVDAGTYGENHWHATTESYLPQASTFPTLVCDQLHFHSARDIAIGPNALDLRRGLGGWASQYPEWFQENGVRLGDLTQHIYIRGFLINSSSHCRWSSDLDGPGFKLAGGFIVGPKAGDIFHISDADKDRPIIMALHVNLSPGQDVWQYASFFN